MRCQICDIKISEDEVVCANCESIDIKKVKEVEDFWDNLHKDRGILEVRNGQLLESY